MNHKYIVRWTTGTAEKNLEIILDFIAEESIDAALNILERLREQAANLYLMPERSRIVRSLKNRNLYLQGNDLFTMEDHL